MSVCYRTYWSTSPLWVLIALLAFPPVVLANSCVDGLWHFDSDNSDNLKKIKKKWLRATPQSAMQSVDQHRAVNIPSFLFSEADLLIEKQQGAVVVKVESTNAAMQNNDSHQAYQRSFSTIGHTKSVSLKNLNKGYNTVVASWEKRRLVVETTTPQGIYIEETFTLQDDGILHILSRMSDGISLHSRFIKLYQHESGAVANCLANEDAEKSVKPKS